MSLFNVCSCFGPARSKIALFEAIGGMAISDSSSTAGSSDVGELLVVETVIPLCSCRQQDLRTLVWIDGGREGRCNECLSRVHLRRLSPADRFAYVCLLALWRA